MLADGKRMEDEVGEGMEYILLIINEHAIGVRGLERRTLIDTGRNGKYS